MIRPSIALTFEDSAMLTYEAAVQREMLDMATKAGAMTAELRCASSTLSAIQPFVEPKWVRTEVAELLGRIDLALAEKAT